jgi:hypothetical protein
MDFIIKRMLAALLLVAVLPRGRNPKGEGSRSVCCKFPLWLRHLPQRENIAK